MPIYTDEELEKFVRSKFDYVQIISAIKVIRNEIEAKIIDRIEQKILATDTLEKVIAEILAWQDVQYPEATQKSRATHLLREAAELYAAPNDAEEAIDTVFLAIGIIEASGRGLLEMLRSKLEKNKARSYGKPDSDGVVEHIREKNEWIDLEEEIKKHNGSAPVHFMRLDPHGNPYALGHTEWSSLSAAEIKRHLTNEVPERYDK